MESIKNLLKSSDVSNVIDNLKKKTIIIPSWENLKTEYYPQLHPIVDDNIGRKDKHRKDGGFDKAARIVIGLEQLHTKRLTEFMFAIPPKRIYSNTDSDQRKEIASAIERIYTVNHISNVNLNRAIAYFASCEFFTLWYTKKEANTLYGFSSKYKLKCKNYSPMDGTMIYPLFDEKDDMIALSFQYKRKQDDKVITFFECYTADSHYLWKQDNDESEWETVISDDEIEILKIPAIYLCRPKPCWSGLSVLREDIEYTLSRNSDVIAYNSAPVLKVSGLIRGQEDKGETQRIFRVENGGDVSYVSWSQSIEALKYHISTLTQFYFMQAQIPDISFENLKSLGNIGYDARKTLLTDAHLKVGDESGAWIEFFERETNVIKAFLKKLHTNWKENDIDAVTVEHVITPYIQEEEKSEIDKWMKANGGLPLVSHLESIKNANLTDNPDETYKEIQQQEAEKVNTMESLFSAE